MFGVAHGFFLSVTAMAAACFYLPSNPKRPNPMNCHKCPHFDSIERGEYDSKPWKDTPCAKCTLGEDTFYSVPFDEENPPESSASVSLAQVPAVPGIQSSTVANIPSDVMAQFIQGILTLEPILRDIVAWRYQGLPYKEIARRQGTSTQLAEMRHKRALRDWPALEALFPEKVAKQSRRNRK